MWWTLDSRKARGVKCLPGPFLLAAGGVGLCIRPDRLQSSHPLPSGVFPYTVFVGPKRQFVSVCVCVLDCVHTHSHLEGLSVSWTSAELLIQAVVIPSAPPHWQPVRHAAEPGESEAES